MQIEITEAFSHPDTMRELFREYTDALLVAQPDFADYLFSIQNFEDELLHLDAKYGPPRGRLYLALADGKPAGCVALKPIDDTRCELKRLYVREAFRHAGLGEMLVDKILADAREIGYSHMLLDTFPFLRSAIRIYRAKGFYDVESYNNSPMDGLVYLQLDL